MSTFFVSPEAHVAVVIFACPSAERKTRLCVPAPTETASFGLGPSELPSRMTVEGGVELRLRTQELGGKRAGLV
jgi:hypothetical protein